jgi:MFS family permease
MLAGAILVTVGTGLMATLDETTSFLLLGLYMAIIGLGVGLVLQNLVLVVQNAVPSRDMGAATSAGQFFRQIGGTIGVSVMGAVLAHGLAGGDAERAGGAQLADAIHPIFLLGVPVMIVAFAMVFFVPELPLRRSVREPEHVASPPSSPAAATKIAA